MDQFAKAIAGNPYLQAISIIVAIGGALIFIWKNGSTFLSVTKGVLGYFAGKIWVPFEVSRRQADQGAISASFLVALLAKHSVVVTLGIIGWSFLGDILDALRDLDLDTPLNKWVYWSLVFLRNIFSLVAGARLGEIFFIAKAVMRRIELEESE